MNAGYASLVIIILFVILLSLPERKCRHLKDPSVIDPLTNRCLKCGLDIPPGTIRPTEQELETGTQGGTSGSARSKV